MQGAERREVVQVEQGQPGQPVSATGAPSLSASIPMGAQDAGREWRTLSALAAKAGVVGQELRAQQIQKDYIKGQMAFQQGKAYDELLKSGASYGNVAGFQAMNAAKATDDMYSTLVQEIEQELHQVDPDSFRELMGEKFTELLTGDQMTDQYLTELSASLARKVAQVHVTAHEAWKVQETKSAAIEMLMSKVNSDDPDDIALVDATLSDDGPLSALSPQDKKSTILSAALLDLENGDGKLYEKLGFAEGLRERFSMQAEDESAITKAVQSFVTRKENAYNGEYEDALFNLARSVRNGELDYTAARKQAEAVTAAFGKGNADLVRAETVMQGAANVWLNKMDAARERQAARYDRLLEKANEDYMKQAELLATADHAINTNSMYSLDAKEKAVAFQRIRQKINEDLLTDVASGTVPPDGVTKEAITRMAKAVDRYGVVDDEQAAFSTAAFNTNLISNEKGEVYAGVMQAYLGLAPLYDINPALALKHLKTDQAKAMFLMARELDLSTDLNEGESLKQAAANSRRGIDMGAADSVFGTKGFNETMQDIALAAVEKMVPSLNPFTTTKRGSVNEISTWEMQRAVGKYEFLEDVTRRAKRHWMQNTGLTPIQAGELAAAEIQSKAAYVVGNILVPEGDDELHAVMGLSKYKTESGAPHEAVVEFLKVNGPALFGKQWFDSEIATRGSGAFMGYLGTKFSQTYRDVPELSIQLIKGRDGYSLSMQPKLNDGSFGASREVTATALGEFYEQWRETEIGKAPRVTPESLLSNIAQ